MANWLRYLPCKCEDPSSTSRPYIKNLVVMVAFCLGFISVIMIKYPDVKLGGRKGIRFILKFQVIVHQNSEVTVTRAVHNTPRVKSRDKWMYTRSLAYLLELS